MNEKLNFPNNLVGNFIICYACTPYANFINQRFRNALIHAIFYRNSLATRAKSFNEARVIVIEFKILLYYPTTQIIKKKAEGVGVGRLIAKIRPFSQNFLCAGI